MSSWLSGCQSVIPSTDLSDGLASLVAFSLALLFALLLTPRLIRRMRAGGMTGPDVNKASKTEVAELGGISAIFAFSVSLSLVVGFQKLLGNIAEPPFLAAISVYFMAAMIGLIDDISSLKRRHKAIVIAFSALPLMLVHLGPDVIRLPLGIDARFDGEWWYLIYWLIAVPIGVTGISNAMNMSAGYNGLESGQISIVSFSLLAVATVQGSPEYALMIFAALAGCSLGLYHFNRFPARVFIGDIGTLGLGAAIGAGAILGHIEFYGIIAIAPAFYEAIATFYYGLRGENGRRRDACHNPVILPDGRLQPMPGAGRYTLANFILSKRPMTERNLVRVLLGLYALSGAVAILLSGV